MTPEQIKEFVKCRKSPVYFIETYCKILHPEKGVISFILYDFQKELVRKFQSHDKNITNKSRQTGISTLTACYALWLAMFHQSKDIIILSIKDEDAQDFLKKVKLAFSEMPDWMRDEPEKDNAHTLLLPNGSQITSSPSSPQATRGRTPALLIIDECAFIKDIEDIWTAALPSLSRGGSAIMISTPNGIGNFFHDTWEKCQKYTPKDKRNDFEPTFVHWTQIPEYRGFDNTQGMTHDEIVEKAKKQKWFKKMRPNISDRKWNQEFEGDFLGSGNTVVRQWALKKSRQWLCDPKVQYNFVLNQDNEILMNESDDGDLWVWVEPDAKSYYVIGADVSSGDSSDYSAFQILDIFSGEQVAEYRGLVNTTMYSRVLDHIGRYYNTAFLVPEITGMGHGVVHNLVHELYYPAIYQTADEHTQIKRKLKFGWVTSPKTRPLLVQSIQDYVDPCHFQFHSIRFWKELGAFVWKNKKAQADGRNNDDLVISMAIAAYNKEMALRHLPHGFSKQNHYLDDAYQNIDNVQGDQLIDPYSLEPVSLDALRTERYSDEFDSEDLDWLFGK